MTTFGLVHGGQQGAWAFDLLIPKLTARGFGAIAVDLPAGDADAGAAEYAAIVEQSLTGIDDHLVLVGHSLGGLTIPLVAVQRPVAHLVFVCAGYPEPSRSHFQVRTEQPGEGVSAGPASTWQTPGDFHLMPREVARDMFFHDCPPDIQEWALARLRPQSRKPLREITPLAAWPATPRTLVIARDDRCIPRDSARRTAQRLFDESPIELPGGHCLAISRPAELADVLASVAG